MVLAIVLGVVTGAVGFIPLVFGLRMTRRVTATSNLGHMGILLLTVFASFIILLGAAIACIMLARDFVLPFVLSEAVALVIVAIAFGVHKMLRK